MMKKESLVELKIPIEEVENVVELNGGIIA